MVINKTQDHILNKGDKVIIFSNNEIENLLDDVELNNQTPNILNSNNEKTVFGSLKDAIRSNIVTIEGSVPNPGNFVLGGPFTSKQVLDLAGGLNVVSDTENITFEIPVIKDKKFLLRNIL